MKLNDAVLGLSAADPGRRRVAGASCRTYPTIPGQQVGPALFPGLIAVGLCIGG